MKKYITIDKKYLLIPVCAEKELKTISISCQGEKIYEFNVPVKEKPDGHYGFHYYAPVNMEEYKGKTLLIEGSIPKAFMDAISPFRYRTGKSPVPSPSSFCAPHGLDE